MPDVLVNADFFVFKEIINYKLGEQPGLVSSSKLEVRCSGGFLYCCESLFHAKQHHQPERGNT